MSKAALHTLAAFLALAVGTLAPCTSSAQTVPSPVIPSPKVSPTLAAFFAEAQRAQLANRWSDVVAPLQQVLASGERKPDDTYAANILLVQAYQSMGNSAEVRKALRGTIESGFLAGDQLVPLIKRLEAVESQ